jgi:hypothetical protein
MKRYFSAACAIALSAALAGCATSDRGGIVSAPEVTRFHLGQPIARGQIAVEAFDAADANSIEFRSYANAVARQLSALGWTVVNTVGQSEQVALVDVQQGSREMLRSRSPVSIGVGGGTGGWGSGFGGDVSVGLGGRGARELIGTMLEVRIKRRSDGTVFWEGRATMEARAGSPEAERTVAVERLASALFQDFPGESGRTIRAR